jgi:uncharacterized protein YbjT (DUF2867 family)
MVTTVVAVNRISAASLGLEPAADGMVHQVTGPERISRRQQLEAIAHATGHPLRIKDIDHDDPRQEMLDDGVPEWLATTVMEHMARSVTDPDPVTSAVSEVTGRPALTYAQWALDHLNEFLPDGAAVPGRPR